MTGDETQGQNERRRQVQYDITGVFTDSATIEEAVPELLRAVCRALDASFSVFWLADPVAGELLPLATCQYPDGPLEAMHDLEQATRGTRPKRGEGLPGQAWEQRGPVCVCDLGVDTMLRSASATRAGLRSALAFPISATPLPGEVGFLSRGDGTSLAGTFGVLEAYLADVLCPDDDLLRLVGSIGGRVGHFIERKRAEEALRRSEAQYRLLLETTAEGIYSLDLAGTCTVINRAAAATLGWKPEEVVGRDFHAICHHSRPDGTPFPSEECPVYEVMGTGQDRRAQDVFWRRDGSPIHVELSSVPIRDGGAVVGAVVAFTDISDRKRAEQRQAAQFAVTRVLAEATTTHEAAPRVLQALVEGLEWRLGELWLVDRRQDQLARMCCWHVPDDALAAFDARCAKQVFRRGEGLLGEVWGSGESAWVSDIAQDGRSVRARQASLAGLRSVLAVPVRGRTEVLGLLVLFGALQFPPDPHPLAMTEAVTRQLGLFIERRDAERALRRSEDQLRQAQKLEAVGQLAGGVAHDFNNMLSVILGYSEMVMLQMTSDDPRREFLGEIFNAGQQAARLTRQLLAFSRQQVLQPRVVDLNEIAQGVQKMLGRLIREDIEFETRLAADLGRVMVDSGQMEQILINLAVNARDAMPRGGRLTLETSNRDVGEAEAEEQAAPAPGRYVMMAMADTGCGMDADTLERIFEPFFTTKEQGRGTGLGLSTVYGIVSQSGGFIRVKSEPGKGSTFEVYLPGVADETSAPASVETVHALTRGRETVLVVEDEAAVRRLTSAVLRTAGYTVLEAGGGMQALELCRGAEPPVALTITDVVMPHMSGFELARHLQDAYPSMKLLFLSGYIDETMAAHGLRSDMPFLNKPVRADLLTAKVREVLDAMNAQEALQRKTAER